MMPFIFIGLVQIIKNYPLKTKLFVILWLLFFPLASSLTDDGSPHASRSLPGAPIFSLISGLGIYGFLNFYQRLNFSKIIRTICTLFLIFFCFLFVKEVKNYFYNYFNLYPIYSARSWEYDQPEVFSYVKNNTSSYQKVCFYHLHKFTLNRFIPFYLSSEEKYPEKFLNTPNLKECENKNSLIIADSADNRFNKQKLIKIIYDPEGKALYNFYNY
jgi:hypothetical protein